MKNLIIFDKNFIHKKTYYHNSILPYDKYNNYHVTYDNLLSRYFGANGNNDPKNDLNSNLNRSYYKKLKGVHQCIGILNKLINKYNNTEYDAYFRLNAIASNEKYYFNTNLIWLTKNKKLRNLPKYYYSTILKNNMLKKFIYLLLMF